MNFSAETFIDEKLISILENSTTYKHVLASKDHIDFRDISILQWDSVTGTMLCYLKQKHRKTLFTQSRLIQIGKRAAVEILKKHGKYKPEANTCLTDSV